MVGCLGHLQHGQPILLHIHFRFLSSRVAQTVSPETQIVYIERDPEQVLNIASLRNLAVHVHCHEQDGEPFVADLHDSSVLRLLLTDPDLVLAVTVIYHALDDVIDGLVKLPGGGVDEALVEFFMLFLAHIGRAQDATEEPLDGSSMAV